jgi:hypothetical protein
VRSSEGWRGCPGSEEKANERRKLLPADGDTLFHSGGGASCEAGKLLGGEECKSPGRVKHAGVRLCERHLRRLELEERREMLRGIMLLLGAAIDGAKARDQRRKLLLRRADTAARLHVTEVLYREELLRSDPCG